MELRAASSNRVAHCLRHGESFRNLSLKHFAVRGQPCVLPKPRRPCGNGGEDNVRRRPYLEGSWTVESQRQLIYPLRHKRVAHYSVLGKVDWPWFQPEMCGKSLSRARSPESIRSSSSQLFITTRLCLFLPLSFERIILDQYALLQLDTSDRLGCIRQRESHQPECGIGGPRRQQSTPSSRRDHLHFNSHIDVS